MIKIEANHIPEVHPIRAARLLIFRLENNVPTNIVHAINGKKSVALGMIEKKGDLLIIKDFEGGIIKIQTAGETAMLTLEIEE